MVGLRYPGGLNVAETAEAMAVPEGTVMDYRDFAKARAS